MLDVTVRLADEEDVPQIQSLIESLMTLYGEPLPDHDAMANTIARQIRTDGYEYVVAETGGHLFGCLLVSYGLSTWAGAAYATLQDFIVEPQWRSQGVGSTMFAYARDRARIRGCAYMELTIPTRHTEAERFFRRWGFQRLERALLHLRLARPRGRS